MTEQQAETMLIAMHTIGNYVTIIAYEITELRKHAEQQTRALESIAESLETLSNK